MNELKQRIADADMVLLGFGEEVAKLDNPETELLHMYNVIAKSLESKNYFAVTLNEDNLIFSSDLREDKITAPFLYKDDPNWDIYMKWLSGTLNKKLLVVEVGVLLNRPNVIRWPFERIVLLNEKSFLYRINKKIPQLPKELREKGKSVEDNPLSFFDSL